MKIVEFDWYNCGKIAFLNGTEGMHETEDHLFKNLADRNFIDIYNIDNLFSHPERLQILPLLNIETIVLGTTGVYVDKLNKVFEVFDKLNYKPKNALITMGEDYFWDYKRDINFYKLMPMMQSTSEVVVCEM